MTPRTLGERERLDWLRLARTESIGALTFAHLVARHGSSTAALLALPEMARRGGRSQSIEVYAVERAEAELAAGAAIGARLFAACEPGFPSLLAVLDPAPPVIWTLGDPALCNRRTVAMVGARAASAAGQRFARSLAGALGEAGYVVVSGMARGIDAAAHDGALASGTIAVLAGGVDDIYPAENARLYDTLKARGCLISERPPGYTARAADFPRRNRLISGLALGVIVVEAELRSGSLITARLAGEQGRDVFAVPGSPLDPRSRGANDLIRQGATLVEDVDDVLRPRTDGAGLASAIDGHRHQRAARRARSASVTQSDRHRRPGSRDRRADLLRPGGAHGTGAREPGRTAGRRVRRPRLERLTLTEAGGVATFPPSPPPRRPTRKAPTFK